MLELRVLDLYLCQDVTPHSSHHMAVCFPYISHFASLFLSLSCQPFYFPTLRCKLAILLPLHTHVANSFASTPSSCLGKYHELSTYLFPDTEITPSSCLGLHWPNMNSIGNYLTESKKFQHPQMPIHSNFNNGLGMANLKARGCN